MKNVRTYLLAAVSWLSLYSYSQDAPCVPLDTTVVVQVDSAKASELFARSKRWVATTFTNSKEAIQFEDTATLTIIGHGSIKMSSWEQLHFTMEVSSKDGRYRAEIRDLRHIGVGGSTTAGRYYPYPSYGALYRCKVCCDGYREYLLTHPNSDGFNPNVCLKIPAEARASMAQVLEALRAGMTQSVSKDW